MMVKIMRQHTEEKNIRKKKKYKAFKSNRPIKNIRP